jgi:hypothetical protein
LTFHEGEEYLCAKLIVFSNQDIGAKLGKVSEALKRLEERDKAELSLRDTAKKTAQHFSRKALDILYETAVMFLYVGAIALLHLGLDKWVGKDAKLFNHLPVSYIIDAGHALAIGRFLMELGKNFLEGVKDFVSVFSKGKDNSGKSG